MGSSFTIKMPTEDAPVVREFLLSHDFEFGELAHALWQARGPGCIATFYRSGKLLLQGQEADTWRGLLGDLSPDARPFHRALQRHPKPAPAVWGGTDEAGKGDYFGPLVVAGVAVRRVDIELLCALGVDDSKAVNDRKISEIEPDIRAACSTEVLVIGPKRYNELYNRIGNLNRLLAWAHAKVIENLVERTEPSVEWVLVDRFAHESMVNRNLGPLGRKTPIAQWPRAESDPAVAAASVLARAAYLRGLKSLSRRYDIVLPGGAGAPVLRAGGLFLDAHGRDSLADVAKIHFATTQQLGA